MFDVDLRMSEFFPLRPSAYLCVLCVNGPFNAESTEIRRGRRENKSDLPLFVQSEFDCLIHQSELAKWNLPRCSSAVCMSLDLRDQIV